MKTHIIKLDKNDDTISVREKMAWSHTGRILLILPAGGHALSSKLELNLIKRQAVNSGTQLALLTKDPETKFFARQLGIPVFRDLRTAHGSTLKDGKPLNQHDHPRKEITGIEALRSLAHPKRTGWKEHPLTRIFSFMLAILALMSIGALPIPGAEITLHPHIESQSITFPVIAETNARSVNHSTGTLPAEVRQIVVEGRKKSQTTGHVLIPDHFAIGALRFSNISDHIIQIPPGAIASTIGNKPVKFVTTQEREISLDPGESIIVSARSMVPGTNGNLPPDSIVAIEGDLGIDTTVTNPFDTHGGTDTYVPAPTESDILLLFVDLKAELEQAARFELESSLLEGDYLIQASLSQGEILEKAVTPEAGEPGNELTLILRIRFQMQVVTGETMHQLAKPILDADTTAGYAPLDGTIQFTQVSPPTIGADGKAHWALKAERKLQLSTDINYAVSQIKGQSIPIAREILGQLMILDEQPLIHVTPTWWGRLPFLPMRIHIIMGDSG